MSYRASGRRWRQRPNSPRDIQPHDAVTQPGGPVVLRTLADHRAFTLRAFCPTCGRSVPLDHEALARRFGWDVLLEDIRRRLKCQRCGRPADRLMVGHEQAATPALRFDKDDRGLP